MSRRYAIHFIVDPDDHLRLHAYAKQEHRTLGAWMREILSDYLVQQGHPKLVPLTVGRPLIVKGSKLDKVQIRELYRSGMSVTKIAEQLGTCTDGAIYWICKDLIRDSPQRQGRMRKKAAQAGR